MSSESFYIPEGVAVNGRNVKWEKVIHTGLQTYFWAGSDEIQTYVKWNLADIAASLMWYDVSYLEDFSDGDLSHGAQEILFQTPKAVMLIVTEDADKPWSYILEKQAV